MTPWGEPPLQVSYDEQTDTLTVDGFEYAGALFRKFAIAPLGSYLRLEDRFNKRLSVRGFGPELRAAFDKLANLPPVAPRK